MARTVEPFPLTGVKHDPLCRVAQQEYMAIGYRRANCDCDFIEYVRADERLRSEVSDA